MRIISKTIERF